MASLARHLEGVVWAIRVALQTDGLNVVLVAVLGLMQLLLMCLRKLLFRVLLHFGQHGCWLMLKIIIFSMSRDEWLMWLALCWSNISCARATEVLKHSQFKFATKNNHANGQWMAPTMSLKMELFVRIVLSVWIILFAWCQIRLFPQKGYFSIGIVHSCWKHNSCK